MAAVCSDTKKRCRRAARLLFYFAVSTPLIPILPDVLLGYLYWSCVRKRVPSICATCTKGWAASKCREWARDGVWFGLAAHLLFIPAAQAELFSRTFYVFSGIAILASALVGIGYGVALTRLAQGTSRA
jgi:hypothetical protein